MFIFIGICVYIFFYNLSCGNSGATIGCEISRFLMASDWRVWLNQGEILAWLLCLLLIFFLLLVRACCISRCQTTLCLNSSYKGRSLSCFLQKVTQAQHLSFIWWCHMLQDTILSSAESGITSFNPVPSAGDHCCSPQWYCCHFSCWSVWIKFDDQKRHSQRNTLKCEGYIPWTFRCDLIIFFTI